MNPHGYDPKALKEVAAKQVAALRVDAAGFDQALTANGPNVSGTRVVVRDLDAVDYANNNWLPRRENEAQASKWTTDLEGMRKYLLGRTSGNFFEKHPDFSGLPGPFDNMDEVEIQTDGSTDTDGTWKNCATDEVTQSPAVKLVPLKPPADLPPPIS